MDGEQWKTILWLRWRLTRNQWSRFGSIGEAAGIIIGAVLICGALLSGVAGFLFGFRFLADMPASFLLILWDGLIVGFLFLWLVGMLSEIQRRESLDLTKLMHLPISLRKVFVFNYLASWVTPSIVIVLPGFLCLVIGLALNRGSLLFLLIPVILGIFFIITSWTYLLRGWLSTLMANEKHRRAILVGASLVLVGVAQLPNLYFQVFQPGSSKTRSHPAIGAEWVQPAHYALPPLWVGRSAATLAKGHVSFALGAILGSAVLGGLALYFGYAGTVRAYQGKARFSLRKPARETVTRPGRMIERRLPFIPDEVAVVALATIRSHLRAPELKMTLFGQVVMTLAFGFLFFRPHSLASFPQFGLVAGAMISMLSLMGAVQLFFNQFGFDRDGFRPYVLSPISRQNLLLGKTLAAFPFVVTTGMAILLIALFFGLLPIQTFLASLLTMVAGFFCFSTVGNWLSIVSPYRMAQGSLKPTKAPPQVTLIIFLGMFLSPVIGLVIFLPAICGLAAHFLHWGHAELIQLAASLLFLVLASALFYGTSGPLGRLLMRRERRILLAVTHELE